MVGNPLKLDVGYGALLTFVPSKSMCDISDILFSPQFNTNSSKPVANVGLLKYASSS